MSGASEGLVRGLKNRHVQMIALGGAIGSGLFLGSAEAIHKAGPSLLLAYALGGMAVFFMARALGDCADDRELGGFDPARRVFHWRVVTQRHGHGLMR